MTDSMQTTLAQFEKGDEITFNGRSQPLTVTSVYESETSRTVSVYVEGSRGGSYRLVAGEHKDATVYRDAEQVLSEPDWVDHDELESVELVRRGADVEPPASVGDEFKKRSTLECVSYTDEYWGYRVIGIERETQQITYELVAYPESTDSDEWVDEKTVHYQDFEERLDLNWEEVDDLSADPDLDLDDDRDDDRDDQDDLEDESSAHARRIAAQLAKADEEDEEIMTDGGIDVVAPDTASLAEEIEFEPGDDVRVADLADRSWTGTVAPTPEHVLELGEVRVRHECGAVLKVPIGALDRLATDGAGVGWVSDAETRWCSECQRERVNCAHLDGIAADGGRSAAVKESAAHVASMNYEDRAEELAERTGLKRREADVAALKEEGLTHQEISEELEISKSAVDTYSQRINERLDEARGTLEELDPDLTGTIRN